MSSLSSLSATLTLAFSHFENSVSAFSAAVLRARSRPLALPNAIDALAGTIAGDHLKTAREALSSLDAEAKEAFKAVEQEFGADLRVLTVEIESLAKLLATARADFEASRKKAYARIEEAAGRAAEAIDPALTSPEATDPRSVK